MQIKIIASDGLPARSVGPWSEEKLFYLEKYINIFSKSMRKRWEGELYFIDLFAGPGRCIVKGIDKEIDGSPLIALKSPFPFARYFFVEQNEETYEALFQRYKSHSCAERVISIQGDCNIHIDDIVRQIPARSLSLAFIDPTGLDFWYTSLQKLAKRKVDLIITFPDSMATGRNFSRLLRSKQPNLLDKVIGDSAWRSCSSAEDVTRYYCEKLISLGYKEIKLGNEIFIRSDRNLPLYCILFACKHPLGYSFWEAIKKIEFDGQRRLI